MTYIEYFGSYHTQKENMTWAATTTYVVGAAILLGVEPFWKSWPSPAFTGYVILLVATAALVFWFMWWQFKRRRQAAALMETAADCASVWMHTPPTPTDLEPVIAPEINRHVHFPQAIVEA